MDLLVAVQRPTETELGSPPLTSSRTARERVALARERQAHRLDGSPATCNGELDSRLVQRHVRLEEAAERVLARAYATGTLSARGRHRVLRVAQTIADLDGRDHVIQDDVLEALALRQRGGEAESVGYSAAGAA
jgi:magnesium chelatase family protein